MDENGIGMGFIALPVNGKTTLVPLEKFSDLELGEVRVLLVEGLTKTSDVLQVKAMSGFLAQIDEIMRRRKLLAVQHGQCRQMVMN